MQNHQNYTQFVFCTSYMHMYFVLMRTVKLLHKMVFFHFGVSAYSINTLPLALADCWGGRDWRKRSHGLRHLSLSFYIIFSINSDCWREVTQVREDTFGFTGCLCLLELHSFCIRSKFWKASFRMESLAPGTFSSLAWSTRILCSRDIASPACDYGVFKYCANAQRMLHVPSDFIYKTQLQKKKLLRILRCWQ